MNDELLNVYDTSGAVIGARPRSEAKHSGLVLGAVNALVVNGRGQLLLQRRPGDKENGRIEEPLAVATPERDRATVVGHPAPVARIGEARDVDLGVAPFGRFIRHQVAVRGRRDSVIAACALKARAGTILTFNLTHFRRYADEGLEIVVPHDR